MKTVIEAIQSRRSIRKFDQNKPIDPETVKHCIELATLAPNSSNLQLWEFYHVVSPTKLRDLSEACLNQSAAKSAAQMVVVVVRKDLFKKRAQFNIDASIKEIKKSSPPEKVDKYIKRTKNYYSRALPFLYTYGFGLLGIVRVVIAQITGLFRPMYRQVTNADIRIVAHKSAALAAQNFMLSMDGYGLHTCPMEGFDSRLIKKHLNLPYPSEINMVIGCGIRDENNPSNSERIRVPFDDVYYKV
ncbi:MAG: nitroreductase family protein [Saprospiraceae bacterium]